MTNATPPALPPGLRVYAVGDIHGRLDLLVQLRAKMNEDARSTYAKIRTIFLGDYIDRGLESRQIIDYLIAWKNEEQNPPIFLLGNHELVFRSLLEQPDEKTLEDWLQFGGGATMMSYGVSPASFSRGRNALLAELAEKVPAGHRDFLNELQVSASFGDYFFCHAGVNPEVALDQQTLDDLVWIRQKFLNYPGPYGKVVVHGHSISLEAELLPNRIGIDTGAYATGRLTALGLEGTKQWLIQTG